MAQTELLLSPLTGEAIRAARDFDALIIADGVVAGTGQWPPRVEHYQLYSAAHDQRLAHALRVLRGES